jgi:phage portal protein BeeE
MGIKEAWNGLVGKKDVVDRGPNDLDFAYNKGEEGVYKAHIPEFLYKPPFGYPRGLNMPFIRKLCKNGYVFSAVQTITDEVAQHDWDITTKEGYEVSDEDLKRVRDFFDNPNANRESFKQLIKMAVTDILEIDAGVWVKVFNLKGDLVELYARDGGSFLKNPDIFGTIRDKDSYIMPAEEAIRAINSIQEPKMRMQQYGIQYADRAAWYQYGWTGGSVPIPFGKDELVYFMRNPRSDSIYGRGPIEALGEILYVLMYGSSYYLDFYLNNNMPEGGIVLEGAQRDELKSFRERFQAQFRRKDAFDNTRKEFFKYPVYGRPMSFVPFTVDPEKMGVITQQQWFIKLFWACFGITPSEMGITEDSNRATEQGQNIVVKRKVVKPLLELLEYKINGEILPHFGIEGIEFKFRQYDIDEDIKKHSLFQMQVNMGIKTPEMIAEDEGIDVERLKKEKEESRQQRMEEAQAQGFGEGDQGNSQGRVDGELNKKEKKKDAKKEVKKEKKKVEEKAQTSEDIDEISQYINDVGRRLANAIEEPRSGI